MDRASFTVFTHLHMHCTCRCRCQLPIGGTGVQAWRIVGEHWFALLTRGAHLWCPFDKDVGPPSTSFTLCTSHTYTLTTPPPLHPLPTQLCRLCQPSDGSGECCACLCCALAARFGGLSQASRTHNACLSSTASAAQCIATAQPQPSHFQCLYSVVPACSASFFRSILLYDVGRVLVGEEWVSSE